METQKLNLFIVDGNKTTVSSLKTYLQNRLGSEVEISIFHDGESCLKKIDHFTTIVIIDYLMQGKNGLEILKLIKEINPKTEVIMLSSNENIAIAVETFRAGANNYVVKGKSSWKKVYKIIDIIITKPIKVIVKGFFGYSYEK